MLAGPFRYKVKSNHAENFELKVIVNLLYSQPQTQIENSKQRHNIAECLPVAYE